MVGRALRFVFLCALMMILLSSTTNYTDSLVISNENCFQHEEQDYDDSLFDFYLANEQEDENQFYTTYGGTADDSLVKMINTSDGGFASVGYTRSYGGSDQDGWLVRTDTDSNHLWNFTTGGDSDDYFNDVVECSDGGFAMIGVTRSYGAGDTDVWLVKTDADGNYLWNMTYGGGDRDRGQGLIECSTSGFALAAYKIGVADTWDGWLIRTNETGELEWSQTYTVFDDDRFEDIVECANGDFALAGWAGRSASERFWLVRTNAGGTQLWSKTYNPLGAERCYSVVECSTGGFAMVGWTRSYGAGDTDVWLVRTDSSGNMDWNETYGGSHSDGGSQIIENDDGEFIIVGYTSNWGEGGTDLWMIKANSTGHHQWNTTRGGIDNDGGSSVAVLDSWSYMVTGTTLSFGAGNVDAWMMRIGPPLEAWNNTLSTSDHDAATEIVSCRDGGYAMAGHTYTTGNDGEIWLVRLNSSGHRLWMQNYTGFGTSIERCNDIIECSDGGFALVGRTSYEGYLIRVDENGTELWDKYIHASGANGILMKIIECYDGGFALSGRAYSAYSKLWAVRTNSTGDIEWNYQFDPIGSAPAATGYDIVECSDHGFAIAGLYDHNAITDDFAGWLLRLNSDGTESWSQFYDGTYDEYWSSIVLAENGDFILAGWTESKGAAGSNGWLMRTDSSGNTIWDYTFGGDGDDSFGELRNCSKGSLAIIGTTDSYSSGDTDVWFLRFDTNGKLLWQQTYGGSSNDYGTGLSESSEGGYVICGYTTSFGAVGNDAYYLRVKPVRWVESPSKLIIEYGTSVNYDLNLLSDYGISKLVFNDITGFSMTSNYIIQNTTVLTPENYTGTIELTDTFGDFLNDTFICVVEPSAPPTWIQTPEDQVIEFGSSFNYDLNATDISGIHTWTLNDTYHFTIDDDGVISNLSSLSVMSYGLQVWVNDSLNNIQTVEFSVTVSDTTNPTWDETPEDQISEYGDSFVYEVNASDLSGIDNYWLNDTTYFQIGLTGIITNTSVVPCSVYPLEVRAYDPYSFYCSVEITITVEDTTDPTWDETPSNMPAEYGELFIYEINASDLSGIDYWINDTTYFQINAVTGVITNTSVIVPQGVYPLEVRAYDPDLQYCSAVITITVKDTTTPQWIIIPPDPFLGPHDSAYLDLNATDLSGLDKWWINNTIDFRIDINGIITNNTLLHSGVFVIQVWVNDTVGNIATEFVTVTVDVTSPTWSETPTNQVFEYGSSFSYDLNASDPHSLDTWWINNTVHFTINADGVISNVGQLMDWKYGIAVYVNDTYGNILFGSFMISFTDTITPNWDQLPISHIIDYGVWFIYDVNASDLSGIHHYWVNDTIHFSIDSSGVISNATLLPEGYYGLEIRAYDPHDNFCTATIFVIVLGPSTTTTTTITTTTTTTITTTTTTTTTTETTTTTSGTTTPPPTTTTTTPFIEGLMALIPILITLGSVIVIVVFAVLIIRSRK